MTSPASTSRHKCKRCLSAFPSYQALRQHIHSTPECSASKGNPRVFCPKCGDTFAHRKNLLSHLSDSLRCGTKERSYFCRKCSKPFALLCHLATHMASPKACGAVLRRRELEAMLARVNTSSATQNQADTDRRVEIAPMKAKNSETCVMQKLHAELPKLIDSSFVTETEGEKVTGQGDIEDSQPAVHPPMAVGELSDIGSQLSLSSSSSASTLLPAEPVCPKCSLTFSSRKNLVDHLSYSASCGTATKKFACKTCGHAFAYVKSLAAHMSSPRACAIVLRRKELRALIESAQSDAEPKTEDIKYPKEGGEMEAVGDQGSARRGKGNKSFVCPKCSMAFAKLCSLSKHMAAPRACAIVLRRREIQALVAGANLSDGNGLKDQASEDNQSAEEGDKTETMNEALVSAQETNGFKMVEEEGEPTGQASSTAKEQNKLEAANYKVDSGVACAKCGGKFRSQIRLNIHRRRNKACR